MISKKVITLLLSLLLVLMTVSTHSYAKRFGGGMSFGKKSFSSSPFKRNSGQKAQGQKNNAKQQQNQSRKQQLSKRGGLMGMLGGLALGGMLGALFFGGAFEGINFMDILLFGGLAFLIYKLMASRKKPAPQTVTAGGNNFQNENSSSDNYFREQQNAQDFTSATPPPPPVSNQLDFPSWFDKDDFIQGAKNAFNELQKAWDSGNLNFIQEMTSTEVFAEINTQFQQQTQQGTTEVISLSAEIIDYQDGPSPEVTVSFQAKINEADIPGAMGQTHDVHENWFFVRVEKENGKQWQVDGIQQIDD